MVRGLKTNKTLNIDELLEYSYSLISIGIEQSIQNAKQIKSMKGIEIKGSELTRIPNDVKELNEEQRATIDKLVERIEEDEDVQNVYHNMKID